MKLIFIISVTRSRPRWNGLPFYASNPSVERVKNLRLPR